LEVNYPGDCVLALAIPLTRERFLADLKQPEIKDFVFQFRKVRGLERADPEFCWQVYETEEAALVAAVCDEVEHHGVKIANDVSLADLTKLLAQFSIVTLVAHSRFVDSETADLKNPLIEFSDGLVTTPELVQAIPIDFSGLLDLTVCNSVIPAAAIRESRPNCLIAGNRRPAELRSRMYLYGLAISLLAKEPQPFVDVITKVHSRRSSYDTKGGTLWKLLGRFCNAMRGRR